MRSGVIALVLLLAAPGASAIVPKAVTGTINVTATRATLHVRAAPPRGRRSDILESTWRITSRKGRPIGRMVQACHWVTRFDRLCYGELSMPLGGITYAGASRTQFVSEFAVTGGTDTYQLARGVMSARSIGYRKLVLVITITA